MLILLSLDFFWIYNVHLVHNAGIVDAKFLDRLPDWPQQVGQRIQIKKSDADRFVALLDRAAAAFA